MNRHQRRKRSLLRKAEALRKLERKAVISRKLDANQREADYRSRERGLSYSPKGTGNRGIYQGFAVVPLPGFGSGSFKRDETAMNDGQLAHYRKVVQRRLDKRSK